ncbi:MAG TPA: MarR family transcriptional regulator [Pseudonocardiaceae bacterium]|jgi:DNA-binding MarR family transcriptional regulator|nr:MarR family transcriptional regulator [Pseudonocardiaceae bacterium]
MTTEPRTEPTLDGASRPALDLVLAIHRLVRGMRAVLPASSINFTQLLVLSQLIGLGPVRIGELAQLVQCSQPTATTVVSSLEAIGYVQRIKDASDGRAIKVGLTERGRDALYDFGRQEAGLLDRLMADLPEAEREIVLAAIPVLSRLAEASIGGGLMPSAAADTSDRSRTTGS